MYKDSMIYDFVEEILRGYFKKRELNINMIKYIKKFLNNRLLFD